MQGQWTTRSFSVSGGLGGTPTIASDATGTLVFRGDRYAAGRAGLVSVGSADAAGGFSNRSRGGGRFRLDGLLLTREKDGKRGVELCFLMPNWDGKVPKTFWIGGDRYERPKKK